MFSSETYSQIKELLIQKMNSRSEVGYRDEYKLTSELLNIPELSHKVGDKIFGSVFWMVLNTSAIGLQMIDIARGLIQVSQLFGVDVAMEKLMNFFEGDVFYTTYYELIGIKITNDYKINDVYSLVPVDSTNKVFWKPTINDENTRRESFISEYYTPNCAISEKGTIKIVKCNGEGFVDLEHFNKKFSFDYELFTLLLSLTTKTGCFGIQYYCEFDSNCILGDKNKWLTMQSNKNFPKKSIERDVNIEHIMDMYKVIQSLPKDKFDDMKRLLQKYAWACQRDYSDSAIDLRTLCESIFLNEAYSNEGSITHLISERSALLLKDTYDERMEVNKLFKSFYGVASKLVHGNNNLKNDEKKIIDNANDLIELALERLINHGKLFDKDYWDKLIFGYHE